MQDIQRTRRTATRYGGNLDSPPILYLIASPYGDIKSIQDEAYLRGKHDGEKDKEIELIKRGKALFNLAIEKVSQITAALIKIAEENDIIVYDFYLNIVNWDDVKSLLVVKIDDYTDDKIDSLYSAANKISMEYNNDMFHWDYLITYYSENLNKEKIFSDGYYHIYEHVPQPREAQ